MVDFIQNIKDDLLPFKKLLLCSYAAQNMNKFTL